MLNARTRSDLRHTLNGSPAKHGLGCSFDLRTRDMEHGLGVLGYADEDIAQLTRSRRRKS